jgi:hypothetical protein
MTGAASRLLAGLSPGQRERACFAFGDDARRRTWSFLPRQAAELRRIVEGYAGRLPDDVAAAAMRNAERAGLENLSFAWAGSTEPGERHYFRIQGPQLLIELDNTQGGGNHIHTVWRDPANDFGDDLLARHYQLHHHGTAPQ